MVGLSRWRPGRLATALRAAAVVMSHRLSLMRQNALGGGGGEAGDQIRGGASANRFWSDRSRARWAFQLRDLAPPKVSAVRADEVGDVELQARLLVPPGPDLETTPDSRITRSAMLLVASSRFRHQWEQRLMSRNSGSGWRRPYAIGPELHGLGAHGDGFRRRVDQ